MDQSEKKEKKILQCAKKVNAGAGCVIYSVCLETELMLKMLEGNRFFRIKLIFFLHWMFFGFIFFVTRTFRGS